MHWAQLSRLKLVPISPENVLKSGAHNGNALRIPADCPPYERIRFKVLEEIGIYLCWVT